MTLNTALVISAVTVAHGILVMGAVRLIVRSTIGELQRQYPARTPSPNSVSRSFQSFAFDILNLGWCVHVHADESYLHLRPAWVARAIGGMRAMSIPWDAIAVKGKATLRYAMLSARVGNVTMVGPAWCLRLADAGDAGSGGTPESPAPSGRNLPT